MQTTDKSNFLVAEAELALDQARKVKSERIKDLGSPIGLTGIALAVQVRGNYAWIAENTAVVRKVNLETGKTAQLLKGHTAPVTSLTFYDVGNGSNKSILISGSWDKSIKLWDLERKTVISSTPAHEDFVKVLLVIPSLKLLVSGSSDKIVRFWDLSSYEDGKPLHSAGSISAHTRPVECLDAQSLSDTSAILYTADTMGVMKAWNLTKDEGTPLRWRASPRSDELNYHRTKVNEIVHGNGQLWSASSDDTVQIQTYPASEQSAASKKRPTPPIAHRTAVKAVLPLSLTPIGEPYLLTGSGDVIRAYDLSSPEEPELLAETDAHWHDVTALRLWMRRTPVEGQTGQVKVEPWVISTSLDGTIRKWRLSELLQPIPKPRPEEQQPVAQEPAKKVDNGIEMTEEEERELAELMGDD